MNEIIIDGQKIIHVPDTKAVYIDIREPFFSAGKKLGWEEKCPGLGINQKIIDFVLKTKSRLVINVLSAGVKYWISWDHIKDFMEHNDCNWGVKGGVTVIVLPWRQTVRKVEHKQERLF